VLGSDCLWRLFLRGVASAPHELALDISDTRVTYTEMQSRALRMAEILDKPGRPRVVVLHAQRSADLYVAYLAAVSLGAVVVPVDPGTPPQRLGTILGALGAGTVMTDREVMPDHHGTWSVLRIDQRADAALVPAREPGDPDLASPMPAYVMFTSGSTGEPKGVPVHGTAVEAYVNTVGDLVNLHPGDRHSQAFSLAFDLSVHDLFVTWSRGATLVPPSDRSHQLMGRYVGECELSHWFSVPSSIDLAARAGRLAPSTEGPAGLRWAGFCGEALTYYQVGRIREAYPGTSISNLYGPTELTIACAAYHLPGRPSEDVPTTNGTVPIGTLFDTVEGSLRAAGEVRFRELLVRGSQRFDGYLDARHNARAFTSDEGFGEGEPMPAAAWYRTGDLVEELDNGLLVHRGRFDDQVKVAGHRVELREVEAHLRRLDAVEEAAVVHARLPGATGGSTLVAFYVGQDDISKTLVQELAASLPPYMIPRRFTRVSSFPLNANGKIDRSALRARVEEAVSPSE
jgi:amino acid adenylation domain-containing protein